MAKDEKNMPDGTVIQPEENAPDNVIPMPDIAGPQVEDKISPNMSAEELAKVAHEGVDDDALRKKQEALLKELDAKADSIKPSRSAKKTAPKDKAAKPPAAEKPKKEKAPRSPRMAGSGKKDAPAAEQPIAPAEPEPPREAPRANEQEQIVYINLAELYAFKDHPFGVRDDAEMRSLVESVKSGGVNQPALVRPREDGGFEIVAGHRRHKASELAGYTNIPCIVRNMTDDDQVEGREKLASRQRERHDTQSHLHRDSP